MAAARAALERIYRWADGVQVPELSRLAGHRQAWGPRSWPSMPPMAAPMGRPTEAVNLLIKRVERVGHHFRKAMASLPKLHRHPAPGDAGQPRTSKIVSMASVNRRLRVAVASSMAQPGAADSFMPGGATTSMRRAGARISTWGSAVSR